jgi:hypothetical protein
MSLKERSFDSDEIVENLKYELGFVVGKPVMRMAGPELLSFIDNEVRRALHNAFARCEALYIREMCDRSAQSSRTLLEGVLAGAELARKLSNEGEE